VTSFVAMIVSFIFLAGTVFSGCSVLSNSASFYKDRRPGPINWRQYTSD
jgi:ABC-type transport system involved in multi-copper enzyme maturation permease subunit